MARVHVEVLKSHTALDPLHARIVEAGLDWLIEHTDLLDGYSYGIDEEATHTRFCVVLNGTERGDCYGVGATLIEAANNALDVLGGECECGDYDEPAEAC
jgi:hypothetical protein